MSILEISGRKGHGKDVAGKIIQYLTSESNVYPFDLNIDYSHKSNWEVKKFADKLKDIICILINCTREQLEDESIKSKELGEEWWYWYMERDGGYSPIILDYLTTTKKELKNYEGLELIKPTIRFLLQFIGTDLLRNQLHPQIWVNSLFADIDKELDTNLNYNKNYKSDYIYSEPIFIKTLEGKYNLYKCCCGKEFKADKYKIKTKHTKSCGCYQKYKAGLTQFKDGRKGTRLWNIYNNMIQRCENVNHPRYKDYGGRGIIVSDEFKPYENFKNWALSNGYTDTLSIDRIDNNDIYCPDNCKFSTDSEQVINTRVRKDNSSGFRGVSKDKHNWRASIQIQGKQKILEYFNTPEEASIAYEKAFLERENLYNRKQVKKGFIITDLRFPNELEAVKKRGGITIRVNRPCDICGGSGYHKMSCPVSKSGEHYSEIALDSAEFDYVIENSGSIEELIEKVREKLKKEKLI